MGSSAGGNAYAQKINEGYTEDQAKKYGVLIGASEGSLQYIIGGVGALGGKVTKGVAQQAINKIDNVMARVAVDAGTNMLSEGSEEYVQERNNFV